MRDNIRDIKEITLNYFENNPCEKDNVRKAFFAYNIEHFRLYPKSHNFLNSKRDSECFWCSRTRTQVRWDALEPECLMRPSEADIPIVDVIKKEEEKAYRLFDRAKKEVPKLINKFGVSVESLWKLHDTYGYDAETVSSIVEIPDKILMDYEVFISSK